MNNTVNFSANEVKSMSSKKTLDKMNKDMSVMIAELTIEDQVDNEDVVPIKIEENEYDSNSNVQIDFHKNQKSSHSIQKLKITKNVPMVQ